jgi:hypothetical protein
MRILNLNLMGEYFHDIRENRKPFEYRLQTDYWRKRLEGQSYDLIRIAWGYPKKGDAEREFFRPWRGVEKIVLCHKHFGPDPVAVYAISVTE